jgi:HD-GYP domain-containing protein (c-di-GMP phosphodiesterase class II)
MSSTPDFPLPLPSIPPELARAIMHLPTASKTSGLSPILSDHLHFFHDLGSKMPDFRNEMKILSRVMNSFQEATGATKGMLVIPELESEQYLVRTAYGLNLSEGALGYLLWEPKRYTLALQQTSESALILNADAFAVFPEFGFEKSLGYRSICFQPLGSAEQRLSGIVILGNRIKTGDFTDRDRARLAATARRAEGELERILFYHELRGVFINMAKAFVAAIEAKDRYTRGHSERVTDYAMKMARMLGWKSERLDVLKISAILHDIGKIGVPESILEKPSQLTNNEYGIVKQHPEGGATIVNAIPQLHETVSGILCHHERFDGRGYPYGLAGEDIPILGRLIAVADTYDAMTSDRPYRKTFSHEQATDEIVRNSGKQFDPDMVEAFLQACALGSIA